MAWFSRKRAPEARLTAPAEDGPPPLAGRYRLGVRIGSGAAAEVVQATDLRTGSQVAIKLIPLPEDLPPDDRKDWLDRLRREATLGRQLQHPDIVAVLDAGLARHHAWLAMERIQGVELGRYAQAARLLPEAVVLRVGSRLAAALAHAHAQGVIHRDLKPANVLVNLGADQVKLADFGVARLTEANLTRTGLTLGTPAYMAPELLAGAPATAASDTYALGVMLFELLTGRRPHQADTLGELLKAVTHTPPASLSALRPDLPRPAVAAVEHLLDHNPHRRPADLAAWAAQVAGLAGLMSRLQASANNPHP